MYLADTNIVSAGSPLAHAAPAGLIDWMERHSAELYLSVITVAEVEDGIAKARRLGATRKADRLGAWLATLIHLYSARILPMDLAVARIAGRMSDRARAAGHAPGLADITIAATAQAHDCIVLTRNIRHFRPLGVKVHDPFTTLP